MRESLYRVADARAWKRLLDSGARIVHRFPDAVVLREPLEEPIEGVLLVEEGADVARPPPTTPTWEPRRLRGARRRRTGVRRRSVPTKA